MRILSGINLLLEICKLHSIKSGSITIGCDRASALKVAQDHHDSHPINKAKYNIRKEILRIENRLTTDKSIKLKWEGITRHHNEEVSWGLLVTLEKGNRKCNWEGEIIIVHRAYKKSTPASELLTEGWFFQIYGRKVMGKLSACLMNRMGKIQSRKCLILKVRITYKGFSAVIWDGIEEAMKSLPLMAKLRVFKFASRFCDIVKKMKLMRALKSNLCPCCINGVWTTLHVLRCTHTDTTEAFANKIKETRKTIESVDTEPTLLRRIRATSHCTHTTLWCLSQTKSSPNWKSRNISDGKTSWRVKLLWPWCNYMGNIKIASTLRAHHSNDKGSLITNDQNV